MIAGIRDLQRPADVLSPTQSTGTRCSGKHSCGVALALTGIIWSRYSTVITPVNWNLFSVNIFLGATGLMQLYRIWE